MIDRERLGLHRFGLTAVLGVALRAHPQEIFAAESMRILVAPIAALRQPDIRDSTRLELPPMALAARGLLVRRDQRKAGLVVLELSTAADLPPVVDVGPAALVLGVTLCARPPLEGRVQALASLDRVPQRLMLVAVHAEEVCDAAS